MVSSKAFALIARNENDLEIFYSVGNENASRQKTEIGEIIKNEIHWDGN